MKEVAFRHSGSILLGFFIALCSVRFRGWNQDPFSAP